MSQIKALVSDEHTVVLEGVSFTEQRDLWHALQKILLERPDSIIAIEASDRGFYRALAKIIYAVNIAGFDQRSFSVKVAGEYVKTREQVMTGATLPFSMES